MNPLTQIFSFDMICLNHLARVLIFIIGLFMVNSLFSKLPIKAISTGPQLPLATSRLILRAFIQEDLPGVFELYRSDFNPQKNPEVKVYIAIEDRELK